MVGIGVVVMCIAFSAVDAMKGDWYPAAVWEWMACGCMFVWSIFIAVEKRNGNGISGSNE